MFSRTEEKSKSNQSAAPARPMQFIHDAEFELALNEENLYLLKFRNNKPELIAETDERLDRYIISAIPKLQSANPELKPDDPRFEEAACFIYDALYSNVPPLQKIKFLEEARTLCCIGWSNLYQLAAAYFEQKNIPKALDILNEVAQRSDVPVSHRFSINSAQANLYIQSKQFKSAREHLIEAMQLDNYDNPALSKKIEDGFPICDVFLIDKDEMARVLKKNGLTFFNSHAGSLYVLALSFLQATGNKIALSLHYFNAAILKYYPAIAPIEYYTSRGEVHLKLGNTLQALADLSFALWLIKKNPDPSIKTSKLYLDRAKVYCELNKLEKVKQDFALAFSLTREALQRELAESLSKVLCIYGNRLKYDDINAAKQYFQFALEIDPLSSAKKSLEQLQEPTDHKEESEEHSAPKKKKKKQKPATRQVIKTIQKPKFKEEENTELADFLQKKEEEAVANRAAQLEREQQEREHRKEKEKRKKARQKERAKAAAAEQLEDTSSEQASESPKEVVSLSSCNVSSSSSDSVELVEKRLKIQIQDEVRVQMAQFKQAWLVGGIVRNALGAKSIVAEEDDTDMVASEVQPLIPPSYLQNPLEKNLYRCGKIDLWLSKYIDETDLLYLDSDQRDFTINALYANIDGEVFDPTGRGLNDLSDGIISSIKPAIQAFKEDPIRILRAFYFSAKLGFRLSDEIKEAIKFNSSLLLTKTKPEKVCFWLKKILSKPYAAEIFGAMMESGVFSSMFPELANNFHQFGPSIARGVSEYCHQLAFKGKKIEAKQIMVCMLLNCPQDIRVIDDIIQHNDILRMYRARNPSFYSLLRRICSIQQRPFEPIPMRLGSNPYALMSPRPLQEVVHNPPDETNTEQVTSNPLS